MTHATPENDPTEEIPAEAREELAHAVETAIESPQQAQGFLSAIPDLSAAGGIKDKVNEVLTAILGAIDTIQQYSWALGSYVDEVQKLEDALRKVQGWVD